MGAIKRKESRTPRSGRSPLSLAARGTAGEGRIGLTSAPAAAVASPTEALPATFTARLVALDEQSRAWIEWEDEALLEHRRGDARSEPGAARTHTHPARSTVPLVADYVGRDVLVCRANRAGEPIVIGVLSDGGASDPADDPTLDLIVERRRVVLAAKTEVVLRCGEGSITLSADGKVTIRGVDVVSSATRTQRIRGGAVRIN